MFQSADSGLTRVAGSLEYRWQSYFQPWFSLEVVSNNLLFCSFPLTQLDTGPMEWDVITQCGACHCKAGSSCTEYLTGSLRACYVRNSVTGLEFLGYSNNRRVPEQEHSGVMFKLRPRVPPWMSCDQVNYQHVCRMCSYQRDLHSALSIPLVSNGT